MDEGQIWNAGRYEKNARFVTDLGMPVVELLAPQPGEHILDLGCGDGVLTRKLADMGCKAVGVDSSPEFVAAARERGVDARLIDGNNLPFASEFDAVFSNAALHWMKPPEKVIEGVQRALKPGGRFVGECGGQGNVISIVTALEDIMKDRGIDPSPLNPWYFPADTVYRALLEKHGFAVNQIDLIPRPTPLPGDVAGWLETFAGTYTGAIPESERAAFLGEVREKLRPKLYHPAEDRWVADYVRLRFRAVVA